MLGALPLLLPIATAGPERASVMDALFTSTSAVCVTGLILVDTSGHWSAFGEAVILVLIQIGGLGIMTLSSLLALLLARRLGLRHRMVAAAESGKLALGDVRRVLIGVATFSLVVEAVVAVLLIGRFWQSHGEPFGRAVWLGTFHAVSAFNNAGFALFEDSLMGFARDPVMLLIVSAAVVVGGLGYPVWVEIVAAPLRPSRWNLHAKLTVVGTLVLLGGGWALFTWFEWTNPATLGPLSAADSVTNGFFHSVMPRTAGFNSIDMATVREPSRLLTEVLMFIGGGSGSTAGGIKVSTFALLGWVMWAEARGDPDVVAFERRIPGPAQRQALTVALLAVGAVVVATMALLAMNPLPRSDVLFEVISALGTVGLSTGATGLLGVNSQVLVMVLMILGRVGPITLFAALVLREHARLYRHPEERPIIG